jgi:hypothetical protein
MVFIFGFQAIQSYHVGGKTFKSYRCRKIACKLLLSSSHPEPRTTCGSKLPTVNDSYMKNERKDFKNVLLSLSDSNYFCECNDFVSFSVRICLFGVQTNLYVLWVVILFYTTVKETRYV